MAQDIMIKSSLCIIFFKPLQIRMEVNMDYSFRLHDRLFSPSDRSSRGGVASTSQGQRGVRGAERSAAKAHQRHVQRQRAPGGGAEPRREAHAGASSALAGH